MTVEPDKKLPEKNPPEEKEAAAKPKKPRWRVWLFRAIYSVLAMIGSLVGIIVFGLIPVNNDFIEDKDGVLIYVTSNPVHADLVFPVRNEIIDWREHFPVEDFPEQTAGYEFVAIGWGDKGFYLETPTWADLKISTALNALLTPSPCCMHVVMQNEPTVGENVKPLWISTDQYRELTQQVLKDLKTMETGESWVIPDSSYHHSDIFYEAAGNYHLLNTCNSWVGRMMRRSGLPVPLLTPLPKSVFLYLPDSDQ